ncbi:MAG: 30S ribosomal protein S6 [Gemmatimonadetes bacterium]|nr:30S ribosomal protein S6 [Gemmatimonadota bacterium]MBT8404296.1 30S ribosomal protein S6 [Gemmatimonadota bacterium]NNK64370.1 30S ribosomal protein S6 [Gemmatimonadota bacterium]
MRLYEMVYIFDATLDEDGVNGKLDKFHGILTDAGANVVEVDHWGARQLAYPVAKHKSGYYVVAHIEAPAEALSEFERIVKLDDSCLRYLVVLNEGELTTGMSLTAEPAPGSVEESEESDEDEEEVEGDSPPEFQGGRGRRRRHEGPAITLLNYKDVSNLSRFLTEGGKILPRRTTKVTARFQRQLGSAVKRARYLALIPYMRDHEA